jgi:hypothetical protein
MTLAPATLAPTPTLVPTAVPDLVGQWELARTCQALVDGLIEAGHPELITKEELSELVETDDNDVPIDWDPTHPCAHALPPVAHSHTFWPNGYFNSYMDTGRRVDDGDWTIVDSQTFAIDQWQFHYVVSSDELRMEPIDPEPCDAACDDAIGWMYAVAFPGQAWTRVTEGPNAP